MSNQKMYSADEICKELGITRYTLANWYRWEKNNLKNGTTEKQKLPEPIRLKHTKGSPRRWTADMLKQLKDFKSKVVIGRNGIYGEYSNPYHKETKKYKKSIGELDTK